MAGRPEGGSATCIATVDLAVLGLTCMLKPNLFSICISELTMTSFPIDESALCSDERAPRLTVPEHIVVEARHGKGESGPYVFLLAFPISTTRPKADSPRLRLIKRSLRGRSAGQRRVGWQRQDVLDPRSEEDERVDQVSKSDRRLVQLGGQVQRRDCNVLSPFRISTRVESRPVMRQTHVHAERAH